MDRCDYKVEKALERFRPVLVTLAEAMISPAYRGGFGSRSFPAMDRSSPHFSQVTGWIPPPCRRVGNCGRFGSVISSALSSVWSRCEFCVIPTSKRRSNFRTRAGPASLRLCSSQRAATSGRYIVGLEPFGQWLQSSWRSRHTRQFCSVPSRH